MAAARCPLLSGQPAINRWCLRCTGCTFIAFMWGGWFWFTPYGASSTGKTAVLYPALSVWGEPNQLCHSWRATANGLEGTALAHNDALLALDEIGEVDPKEAGDVAYMLANGQGKTRAGKYGEMRLPARWRLVF